MLPSNVFGDINSSLNASSVLVPQPAPHMNINVVKVEQTMPTTIAGAPSFSAQGPTVLDELRELASVGEHDALHVE